MVFDFIVPRRPVSFQTTDRSNLKIWKDYVFGFAFREWSRTPVTGSFFRFSVVFLCDEDPPDINNVIKPIEDALCGLVYPDDDSVLSVDGHTRFLSEPFDVASVPNKLAEAYYLGGECVYVRVCTIEHEEIFL